jgi:general secretion pathway protein C
MDVAKQLAQWKEQPPEQWLAALNRHLPPAVTAILVLTIAYQLAALTWALVPGSTETGVIPIASVPGASTAAASSGNANFASLASAHLFGEAPKTDGRPVVPVDVVDAPDTTLSLSLTGILATDEDESGGKVIIASNRGQERSYTVGQEIDNANGATLHSVYADRVLLNRGDRLETLRLPKEPTGGTTAGRPSTSFLPPASAPVQNDSLRNVISQNASRLTDIIRLAPHVQEGQVVGFRVTPGRDRETFEALGLQSGDVVTDINGTVLDDPSSGLQVFESLGEATMANVTVLREGVPQVIVIDTSQLQNLREGRE